MSGTQNRERLLQHSEVFFPSTVFDIRCRLEISYIVGFEAVFAVFPPCTEVTAMTFVISLDNRCEFRCLRVRTHCYCPFYAVAVRVTEL